MTALRQGLGVFLELIEASTWAFVLCAMAVLFIWRPVGGWAGAGLLIAAVAAGIAAEGLASASKRGRPVERPAVIAVRRGIDVLVDLAGSAAWALAIFVLGARLASTPAGALLALATFVSISAFSMQTYVQEARSRWLSAGTCPRCRAAIAAEHRHRRWDAGRGAWLAPVTTWECDACGYGHNEAWLCPRCPTDE